MWLFTYNHTCFGYIQITTLNNKNTFGAPYSYHNSWPFAVAEQQNILISFLKASGSKYMQLCTANKNFRKILDTSYDCVTPRELKHCQLCVLGCVQRRHVATGFCRGQSHSSVLVSISCVSDVSEIF